MLRNFNIIVWSLLWLVFIALLSAPPVQSAEFPNMLKISGSKDLADRHVVERVSLPWSAIGRVNNRRGGFCTGTLIGPKKVLTAAHCLWDARTRRWASPAALQFLSGYRLGAFLAASAIEKFVTSPAYRPSSMTRSALQKDWAILFLKSDISKITGIIPVKRRRAPAKITLAGYRKDKPHILTLHKNCNITRTDRVSGVWFHNCNATKGQSGGPILYWLAGRYELIGIHTASRGRGVKAQGVAVPLDRISQLGR